MILTILFYGILIGTAVAILIGGLYLLIMLFYGATAGGAASIQAAKNHRFYKDCQKRGIIDLKEEAAKEKVALIGRYHKIEDPIEVFKHMSNPEAKVKKKMDPEVKAFIIGALAGFCGTVGAFTFVYDPYLSDKLSGSKPLGWKIQTFFQAIGNKLGASIFVGLILAFCIGILASMLTGWIISTREERALSRKVLEQELDKLSK